MTTEDTTAVANDVAKTTTTPPSPSEAIPTGNKSHDDIERSLGISEYLSTSSVSGFSAVMKARYSDFLVHEIDMDGTVARLTSLEVPKSESPSSTTITPPPSTTTTTTQDKEPTKPTATTEESKPPPAETDAVKDADNTKEVEHKEESAKPSHLGELESQLAAMIGNPEVAQKVMAMLESHTIPPPPTPTTPTPEESKTPEPTNPKDEQQQQQLALEKFVTLPALEKQQRKSVHEWVRTSLKSARADTLDGKIRIWHCAFEKEMPNYKAFGTHKKRKMSDRAMKKKARTEWPRDRPDFLRFCLYKENCDTTTATREISRKGNTSRIGYAGMKDKRGITTQFCTMYRTLPEQIAKGTQSQRGGRGGGGNTKQKGYSIVHIGNFEYVPLELRLGSLKGNRFDIILRNVKFLETDNEEISDGDSDPTTKRKEILEKAAQSMKAKGFINYFGTQRFGKFRNTHLVGIAVLQGDFEKAVGILMEPNSEDRPDIVKARKDWQDRFTYGKTKENESNTAKRVLKRYENHKKNRSIHNLLSLSAVAISRNYFHTPHDSFFL